MTGAPARRRATASVGWLLALACGCGCERAEDSGRRPAGPDAAARQPARLFAASGTRARPEVVLLDAGAGDLRPLRLRPEPGDEQTLVVNAASAFSSTLAEVPGPTAEMPTTRRRVELVVEKVGPDGAIVLGMRAFALELHPREGETGSREKLDRANRATARALEGAHGEALLHEQGFVLRVSLELPLAGDPAERVPEQEGERFARQLQGSFLGALDGALPALPEEPVGTGARWAVTQQGEQDGKVTREEVEYEIVGLDDRRLDLAFRFVRSAPPQAIALPGGQQAQVLGLAGSGEGELHLDLARALPTAGRMSSTSTWELESRVEGEPRRMTTSEVTDLDFAAE